MSRYKAFTITANGVLKVLNTPCQICEAISVKELAEGKPHPHGESFTAVWDTGASSSAISRKIVDALHLIPTGRGISKTAGGTISVETYSINVLLPTGVGFSSLSVACVNMEPDILIGMDIISLGDFSLTHQGGKTCFSFQTPSSHYVDYVQELEKYKKMHETWAKSHNEKCPCGSGKLWKNCHGA